MQIALELAQEAAAHDEVPIGCVIVNHRTQNIVATAYNRMHTNQNPTDHAEILALREANAQSGTLYLEDYDLYVTLEPCPMCAQAISFYRIRRLYYGAYDPKRGGVDHGAQIFNAASCFHQPEIYGGMMKTECAALLDHFFASRR